MYGGWVNPDGSLIEFEESLIHAQYYNYGDASADGAIAFTYGSAIYDVQLGKSSGMVIRFNPLTVTDRAVSSIIKIINKSNQTEFFISDIFMKDFDGIYRSINNKTIVKLLRQVLDNRELLSNSGTRLELSLRN